MALRIRKGDSVIILTGKDKGKKGSVLNVIPEDHKVVVAGINMVKRHRKPSRLSAGGVETLEAPIHISNVALEDPKTGKPTRFGVKLLEDGKKIRIAKKSGEAIDK